METKQETKSLPRNRKCGNCRYFEPAPLWRKGWCRNPRLYDRRANHLVDSSAIDCEHVFRARIYWEPVPASELGNEGVGLLAPLAGASNLSSSADGGVRENRPGTDGILRPTLTANKPVINRVETPREKTAVLPNMVKRSSALRKWMLENIPYYDKVDGPLSRVNWMVAGPAIVIGLAVLIIFFNIIGGGKKADNGVALNTPAPQLTSAPVTTLVNTQLVLGASTAAAPTVDPRAPTPTLSNALPTATPEPPKTTTAASEQKAKVVGTGTSKSLNLRRDTNAKDDRNILVRIPEGETVTIVGSPRFADGIEWWQVSYKGQIGWAAKDYLQKL